MEPTFRPVEDTDLEAIVALLQAAFPRWPAFETPVSALEHLRWKLEGCGLEAGVHTVMVVDGRVSGVGLQFCREVVAGGETVRAHSGADAAILPALQGQRLTRVGAAHVDQSVHPAFDLAFNTESNHPRLRSRNRRRGLQQPFGNELRVLLRTFRPRVFLATHQRTSGWTHLAHALWQRARPAWRRRGRDRLPALQLETIERCDRRFDALSAEVASSFDFIATRPAAYLNWRYLDRRGGESLMRAVTSEGELLGYGVLKHSDGWGTLVDLLVHPTRLDALPPLIADLVGAARERECGGISCALPRHHPYRVALEAAGFIDDGRGARLQYQSHRPDASFDFLQQADARIHVTFGDFDYV